MVSSDHGRWKGRTSLGHGGLLEGAGLLEVKLVELQADEVAVLPAADEGVSDHHQVDTYVAQVP